MVIEKNLRIVKDLLKERNKSIEAHYEMVWRV